MQARLFSKANFLFILILSALIAVFFLNVDLVNEPIENLHNPISLDTSSLLIYSLRSIWRMAVAIVISVIFGLIYGMLAAKCKFLESILLAILDILQSVPIIGFLSFTIVFFLSLSPKKIIGAEMAVIFAFFTSQAWNIAFTTYQSFKTLPKDLQEVSEMLDLVYLEKFLKFELPFAMPGLLWNIMISMSGGWVYIVMSESISMGDIEYKLPGIGSYLAESLSQKNHTAMINCLITICGVIFIFNQLFFKPLVAWSEKFKIVDANNLDIKKSGILDILGNSSIANYIGEFFHLKIKFLIKSNYKIRKFFRIFCDKFCTYPRPSFYSIADGANNFFKNYLKYPLLLLLSLCLFRLIFKKAHDLGVNFSDLREIFTLTCLTFLRVLIVSFLAVFVWTPISIYIGFRPKIRSFLQPIIQILAALPMQLFFPLVIIFIDRFKLNQNIWLSIITMISMQYYLLFNIIAGSSNFSGELMEVVKSYNIRPYQKWIKIILPAIFPYVITGCITATGSAWNASIIAEVVSWGDEKLIARGIGSYIIQYSESNDRLRLSLGIISLVIFVTFINKFIWHPLYRYASKHI